MLSCELGLNHDRVVGERGVSAGFLLELRSSPARGTVQNAVLCRYHLCCFRQVNLLLLRASAHASLEPFSTRLLMHFIPPSTSRDLNRTLEPDKAKSVRPGHHRAPVSHRELRIHALPCSRCSCCIPLGCCWKISSAMAARKCRELEQAGLSCS